MFDYISLHLAILVPNNSFIIPALFLAKFVTYYSQYYASIIALIGSGQPSCSCVQL